MKKIIPIFVLIAFLTLVYPSSAVDNCLVCHSTYDFGEFSSINKSLFGVHININPTDMPGTLTNYDCVECHYNVSNMYTPGFTVATRTCEYCHINNPSGPIVSNHIPNGSTNISLTGASCVDCHNKTANLYRYSSNASVAHYGRNASFGISPGAAYCAYCHANSSTIYKDVMENQNNINLGNHTSGRFSRHLANPGSLDGGPDCTTCHSTGRMHDANLTKPVLNSKLCNACHQMDTIKKDLHAGKIECAQCHTEVNSDIHNIKYLLQDGTYRSANATGCPDCHGTPWIPIKLPFPTANCTTCHLGSGLANLTQFADAPLLPSPITHSSNPASGGLWNGSSAAYWDRDIQMTACKYCHGNTLHDTNPLGNVSNIQSGNALNQSITNTSFWCANCHYNGSVPSGNYFYNATTYTPLPPEIQNRSGLVPAQASDGTNFYNHSLDEYSDKTCQICHATNSPRTTAEFIHNVSSGGGTKDCISCHNIGGGAPLDKQLNISAMNQTSAIHYNLNNNSAGLTLDPANQRCWACHGDGNGTEAAQPSGHPVNYKTPKNCTNGDCHTTNQSQFNEPMVYNHFNGSLNKSSDKTCQICHATNSSLPTAIFIHNISAGKAGKDCVSCHKIGGAVSENKQLDISAMNRTSAIHYTLNSNSVGLTLNPANQRCWACHGDGNATESAQPSGHPTNYKTPKNCSNGDCHIINQSQFNEPMLYSHFNNSERVNNPGNLVSDNISTRAGCQECHDESLENYLGSSSSPRTAVVSHYGSTNDLVDLTDSTCTYCHRDDDIDDKDYAQDWGNATDPMDNVSSLTDIRKVQKITVATGDSYNLGNGFYFTVDELDIKGGRALLALYRYGIVLARPVVETGGEYLYSQWWVDDGNEFNQTLVSINTTSVFRGDTTALAQFEARGIKRLHNSNDADVCWLCHTKTLTLSQDKYIILAKDEDRTYYTPLYADFDAEDSPVQSIAIVEGSEWDAGEYSLKVDELDLKGQKARISLYYKDNLVEQDVVLTDDVFEYYKDDIVYSDYLLDNTTFFTAKVTGIFGSSETLVATFEDVKAMSLAIIGISGDDSDEEYGNEWVGGYNVSWLRVNDTFMPGGKPDTIHSPRFIDGADGGPDCLMCHDRAAGSSIPRVDISFGLGAHGGLNINASSKTILSNDLDKACWACHGDGKEPESHFKTMRKTCNDCHRTGLFDAPDLSGVPHGIGIECTSCHGGKHEIKPLRAGARIDNYNLSNTNPIEGDRINLSVVAASGWGMLIEDVEYFINDIEDNGIGVEMAAMDGAFDSQTESAYTILDTAILGAGSHTIYVHAKQRDRWGEFMQIHIVVGDSLTDADKARANRLKNIKTAEYLITLLLSGGLLYLLITHLKLGGKLH